MPEIKVDLKDPNSVKEAIQGSAFHKLLDHEKNLMIQQAEILEAQYAVKQAAMEAEQKKLLKDREEQEEMFRTEFEQKLKN